MNVLLRQGRVNGTVYAHCNELCTVFRKFVGSFRSDHDVFGAFRCCLTENVLCGSAKIYDRWHAYGNALYPEVERESSFRAFSTPLPGEMPVLQSCIVLPRLVSSLQASASTAITACGVTRSAIAFTCSEDSIPVFPSTPGCITVTSPRSSVSSSFARLFMWRVAKIFQR